MIEWSFLDNSDVSINGHFNTFYEKTTECISNHIPKKKVSKKDLKLRSKPWINNETQRLINYRDKLFNNMIKNPSPSKKNIYTGNFEIVWSLSKVEEKLAIFKDTLRHTKQT